MTVNHFEKEVKASRKSAWQELCCFVASLLHSELAAVHLPTIDTNGETSPTNSKLLTLMEAIGAESPGLELLHVRTTSTKNPPFLTHISRLGEKFFRVLPRLTSLKVLMLDLFRCDDWGLQQFAMHATNLV
jgi:hypothetical protein